MAINVSVVQTEEELIAERSCVAHLIGEVSISEEVDIAATQYDNPRTA